MVGVLARAFVGEPNECSIDDLIFFIGAEKIRKGDVLNINGEFGVYSRVIKKDRSPIPEISLLMFHLTSEGPKHYEVPLESVTYWKSHGHITSGSMNLLKKAEEAYFSGNQ